MSNYDIVVVGAGPGGYVTAIRAAQLGFKVAIVEDKHLGGICLNWGCIPTKALLKSAAVYKYMKNAENYGLSADNVSFDIHKIIERSRNVSKQLSSGIGYLMSKNKIEVVDGFAKILSSNPSEKVLSISKDGKEIKQIKAKKVILATGASPKILDSIKPNGKNIWTYKDALSTNFVPKKMLVVGSGAIGIEFASFFNELGTKVTVCEFMDRILPVEDKEISEHAKKSFEKQGMVIKTNTSTKSVKDNGDIIDVVFDNKGVESSEQFDVVLSAVGVVPNSSNIGLENTKVKLDKAGFVVVDNYSKTDDDGIYAIGDLSGAPCLAHKAEHEGVICVEKIKGLKDVHPLNLDMIPGCTYSYPQIASVGLTEQQAIDKKIKFKKGVFPLMANGKAIAVGESDGFVKTIFDEKTGELLGAHMVGADVTEMIGVFSVANTLETTEIELMHSIIPHPTIAETIHESVLDAYDKALHI